MATQSMCIESVSSIDLGQQSPPKNTKDCNGKVLATGEHEPYENGDDVASSSYASDRLSICVSQQPPTKDGETCENAIANGRNFTNLTIPLSSTHLASCVVQNGNNSIFSSNSCTNVKSVDTGGISSSQNSVGDQVFMIFKDGGSISNGVLLKNPLLTDVYNLQSNINNIYAVAQASLVAQTQEDIARQFLSQTAPNTETINQHKEAELETVSTPENSGKNKSSDKDKKFICKNEGCGRIFSSAGHLRNHQQSHQHEKALVCDFEGCGRKFTYKAHLTYHKLTHTNDRKHKCKVKGCGMLFFTAQRLQVHMRVHTGDRPFWCQECGKGFTTAGNLKNHSRIHSGERPYVCKEEGCEKRFAEYSSLRKHKLTHTGERPFKCEKCGRSFTQTSSRMQHMKRHLMNPDEVAQKDDGESDTGIKEKTVEEEYSKPSPTQDEKRQLESKDRTKNDHNYLPISNEMLLAEEVFPQSEEVEETIVSCCASVVVLSEPQITANDLGFHPASNPEHEEIVYNTDYLHSDLNQEVATQGIIQKKNCDIHSDGKLDPKNVLFENENIGCQNCPLSHQTVHCQLKRDGEMKFTDTLVSSTPQEYKMIDPFIESDGEMDTLYKS